MIIDAVRIEQIVGRICPGDAVAQHTKSYRRLRASLISSAGVADSASVALRVAAQAMPTAHLLSRLCMLAVCVTVVLSGLVKWFAFYFRFTKPDFSNALLISLSIPVLANCLIRGSETSNSFATSLTVITRLLQLKK